MHILTDTHAHTIASSHAYSTVHDHLEAAKKQGLELFAITDHGTAMPDSPHEWHFGNMGVIPRVVDDVAILRGMEANILPENMGLDLPPYPLDIVIASMHTPVLRPTNKTDHTKALIKVIESGECQIIGHPGNPAYPIDIDDVVKAAKDNNVLLEINNSSFSLSRTGSKENCRKILERIAHFDWKVSFGSDAHVSFNLGRYEHCLLLVEELEFPIDNIVSTTPEKLLSFLAEHGKVVHLELNDWLQQRVQARK